MRQLSLSLCVKRLVLTHCSRCSAPLSLRHSSLLFQSVSGDVRPPLMLTALRSTLPPALLGQGPLLGDELAQGLAITGQFLHRELAEDGRQMPEARARLLALLAG